MDKKKSNKIISGLASLYRDVRPGLIYKNIYQLAVSVILSAQTTDRQVNSATPRLFKKFPDFENLSRARKNSVERIIKSTGFYRNKAKNIVAMSKSVMKKYNGTLPAVLEELISLPGIGRKSANVILSMGFGIPAIAVDTHVLRIANRLGYVSSQNPEKAEAALESMIPEKDWILSHMLFIKHGRTLCAARKPLCLECPINHLCLYFHNRPCTP